MASSQDARPFVDLQKDAEEFVDKFKEDIAEWKSILDSKIRSLICDPDSFGNSGSYEKNPLVEFSKAKYAIFISMKSLANNTEKEWIKYISEMKKLFLENVEIFLAGTKLEVKLPSYESQSISDTKKSPINRKSSLVPSSLYPILSNFSKNIPALSSRLQSKEAHSSESEETETMFSQRNRSFTSKMEIDEVEMDLNTSKEKDKSKETRELNSHVLPTEGMELEDAVDVKPKASKLQERGNKSKFAAQNKKSKAKGILKKGSGSESQDEARELKSEISLMDCYVDIHQHAAQDEMSKAKGVQVSSSESQEDDEFESEKNSSKLLKGRGRRGRKPAIEKNAGKNTISEDSEETSEIALRSSHISSSKAIKENSRSNKTAISKMSGQSSSEDDKKLMETEINTNVPPVKGRRGRQVSKSKEKENGTSKILIKMSDQSLSEDNEKLREIEVYNIKMPAIRGQRWKQSKNDKKKNVISKLNEESSSEEKEKLKETEINTIIPAIRNRRGKQAASKEKEKENVFKPENQVDEAVHEEEKNVLSVIPGTRKGRSAAAKTFMKPSDPAIVSNTRRGRTTTKDEGQAIGASRKRAGRKTLNERISESDASLSPVRVILPVEEDIDDDLDVYTPVTRPTKSSARRKTLLPSMDEPASVAENTVKGNSTRTKSKRKTISGVSDLASMAPSKRLKISSSQMSNTIIEDEVVGDDNLLDKNDSYSDWITLKNVDGKIPTSPAIYEMKVWRAKKSAYIGSCESLRQILTLHKLKQNSGHKHLDKFIDRNYNDIQVRYEVVASLNIAKAEVKNRINNFVAEHKTTPAYN